MEVIICQQASEASDLAARMLKNQILQKKQSVLGLATGTTPLTLYQKFIDYVRKEGVNVSEIVTFNLDEYVGIPPENSGSYTHYMQKNFVEPLGLKASQFNIPDGMAKNIQAECEAYEKQIKKQGPNDLQILGLGRDGHIGFNEPGSSLGSRTRLKSLTEETRKINQSYFPSLEQVPRHVITMGIQTIMDSRKIALLAFGEKKAKAVAQMVEGPVTALVPASILQFHPRVKIFLDEGAASLLANKGYYQEVFAHKPSWQMAEFV